MVGLFMGLQWAEQRSPKTCYVIIPRACEYIRFHGKRDTLGVIKLRIKVGDYPDAFWWTQCDHMGP